MKTLINKYMEIFLCTKEEAERYVLDNIMRIRQEDPQITKTVAINALNEVLS